MVKIPSLDELKKMGSELMDSAKASRLGSMISNKEVDVAEGSEDMQPLFQNLQKTLQELNEIQAKQASLMKQLESQAAALVKKVAAASVTGKAEDKFE